ncbi:MAG TPA: 50S ribosomal protein L25 [bacterium]|nr:MAG: 50S ribosomal protein L25 [Parcubacteria group bacterium ADurb.Bin192]HPN14535.1 50S ribosomal protein L25 [bacterium]
MTSMIKAQLRDKKESAATTKEHNMIKAVVYGREIPNRNLFISANDFFKLFRDVRHSMLLDLEIDQEQPVKALIGEVQVNPVNMQPVHVDFRQVRMDETVTVPVPLVYVGESAAVKALGGTLVKSLDTLEVECLPGDLPKQIEVDLSVLQTFEDMITVGSLNMPKGVSATHDPEDAIATVEAPLTEEQIKELEAADVGDVTAVKTEAEEKKEQQDKAADESEK